MVSQFSHSEIQVEARSLRLRYAHGEKLACQVEELHLARGQCLILCGPSGSGKSSLLHLINGLVPEYYPGEIEGSLRIGQLSYQEASVERLAKQVASVFQNPTTQFFHQEVLQELVFPCENQGMTHGAISERLAEITEVFRLEQLLQQNLEHLSGGQKQVVAIATAAMQGTDIMVFDEPTANLDAIGVKRVQELLLALKKQGKTLIIAEHRLAYLTEIADFYAYFYEGQLLEQLPAPDFMAYSEEKRAEWGLRTTDLIPYQARVKDLAHVFTNDQAGLELHQFRVYHHGDYLYQLDQLVLAPGQVVGLIGANGSGKTSFARSLVGLEGDKTGPVNWKGQVLHARKRLAKMAYVMQDVRQQLVTEQVEKELSLGRASDKLDYEVLRAFRLTQLLDRHPMSLSLGEQQRLMIAASLLSDKEIIILDEPSSGLDREQMEQLATQLQYLKAKGKLVLLISHDDELLARVCDKVVNIRYEGV
ncbi:MULTISPECIES: ABC transporter ATP-binding protein [unclassified Streptococcus]|uniref:ABC transporter ATP-binding protein n=1 Tax=unclassified Streptococcus TaxID=2608887 RepID=UPI0010725A38|nr:MULTISPECIES: ABC transporter ATP-binding protein [unclassified Streptococcus]MBF0787820.1 ABC transporter ATP-binding protein [Streptococcus sp. 19428wC2_LYSM12]MCQ9211176.1 ABC transporter ATP-binding protein [Streptococcus sp. B01]MCQ9214451.1 ABC transporter ATP-binding protein [Streptococcus sp. O1]TFV05143.1 ABC transporter ATP-binding protein [Streptococcus sp. LYSM12]